jgi:hypothetical protein
VPLEKKLTRQEIKKLKNQKGLLGRFNYVIKEEKLYIKDNADKIANLKTGTEILKINDALFLIF